MVYGIGVDSVEIARMEQIIKRPRFVKRVFSEAEQERLAKLEGKRRAESAAACFAAKEAFLKACGRGLGGFSLADIAALRRESGAPFYALSGSAAVFVEENGLQTHLSLTHEAGLAIAFTILEKEGR